MATNWKTPTGADVWKVISTEIIRGQNENVPADISALGNTQAKNNFDKEADNRAVQLVQLIVVQFRAAIDAAGVVPLSLTPLSIPPEAEKHVLNMAAWELASSTKNLVMYVVTESGMAAPFKGLYDEAKNFLARLSKGEGCTRPTDPTQAGDGTELVVIGSTFDSNGSYALTLSPGVQYSYKPGQNESNFVCGSTTLLVAGTFYASSATATLSGAAGYVVTGSLQVATDDAVYPSSAAIVGEDDLSTD